MSKGRVVAVLVLVSAARLARAEDWPALGADEQRTRRSPEQSEPAFSPSWSYTLGTGKIVATPVTSDGKVIVAGLDGSVAALDARDGTPSWKRTAAGGVGATPLISNGQVAIPTLKGALISFKIENGDVAWQQELGGQNYSSPLLLRGRDAPDSLVVGVGFPNQEVWRLDARSGELVWKTVKDQIADLVLSSAAVAGDRVVIGMNHGRYQALDVATGATAWKFDASGQVGLSSPLVMGDRIYTFPGDANASVFAANADTGAAVSGFPVSIPDPSPIAGAQRVGPGPAPSSPMSIDGLVIVQLRRNETLPSKFVPPPVSMREYVVAIDPISAQVRWQVLIASRTGDNTNDIPELNMCATPAGFSNGDTSYVAVSSSLTGRVSVLDARTGQERWAAALSGPGRASPVLSNGFLLVATDAGVLHAFKSKSNQAPMPPAKVGPPGGELAFAASGVRLDWSGAEDADGGPLSYRVRVEREDQPETRIDTDTAPGESSLTFKASPGVAYLVAVRTRDAQGALSEWSAPQSIRVGPDLPPPAAATMPANTTTPVETMTPGAPVGTMPPMSEAAPAATPPAASPASSSVPIVTDSTGPSGGCSVPGDRGGAAGALLFVGLLAVRRRHQGKVTDA